MTSKNNTPDLLGAISKSLNATAGGVEYAIAVRTDTEQTILARPADVDELRDMLAAARAEHVGPGVVVGLMRRPLVAPMWQEFRP